MISSLDLSLNNLGASGENSADLQKILLNVLGKSGAHLVLLNLVGNPIHSSIKGMKLRNVDKIIW